MTKAKLLRAPRVLTGHGGEHFDDGEILIDGDKILGVGARGSLPAGAAIEVQEFPGCTMLPGLIDCHVHVGFDRPASRVTPAGDAGLQLVLRMVENCRKLAAAGVTTARDLGAHAFLDVVVRDAIEQGLVVGPHLVVATRPITVTGGHCWFMGGEADSVTDLRRVARENLRAGADCLKIMATGGAMTPNGPPMWRAQYRVEELRAVVDEARSRGKHVAAHAPGTEGIRLAAEAGVATIEHCSFRTSNEISSGGVEMEVVETILANDVFVCPTFSGAFHAFAASLGQGVLDDVLGRVAELHRAGVKLVAGTDSGFFLHGIENPMDDYVSGLEMLQCAGLSNAEIMTAATLRAAEAIGLGDVTGSLEEGKRADLIVVRGNPLDELGRLRDLELVLVSGRRVTQTMIDTVASSVAPSS